MREDRFQELRDVSSLLDKIGLPKRTGINKIDVAA
jgi:hypothetical protein